MKKKKSRNFHAKGGEWYLLEKGAVIYECSFCSLKHKLEAQIVRGYRPYEDRVAIRFLPHK